MIRPPIDVLLFDLGNVILPFSHYQIAEKLSRFVQNKEFQDPRKIFSYLFDLESGAVNDYEVGQISSSEFFQSLKELFQLTISLEEFIPIWNDIFTEDREVSEIILSQKGKRRLGLLSNTNPLHFDYVLTKFPILRVFDRWILSHEVGYKKPARQIFEKALEWASVKPERVLYVDDIKKYVDVAISFGMQSIHFVSSQQLKGQIGAINGMV